MKHILIIDPADFVGGAELFTLDFLQKVDLERFRITLATGNNKKYLAIAKKTKAKIHFLDIQRLKKFSFTSLRRLRHAVKSINDLIDSDNIDLIQTNSIRAHICGAVSARIKRKKIIWIIHDCTFPRFFLRLLIPIPEKIVVATEFVRDYYRVMLPKRFHAKFTVIPNGIDLERIQSMTFKDTLKKELNLGLGVQLVGIVGRIDWWKGHDHFIRAAAKVVAKLPKTRFLIVGEPSNHDPKTLEFEAQLQELVHDLHLEREVFFLGFKPDIFQLIHQLDVLIHASTEPEPFGRVVLEAMAVGTPVIASPLGGPSEIIEDGRNGLLVDPREHENLARSMCRILERPKLREKFRENGLRTIQKHYDLKKIVKRIEKLWEV